MGPRSSRDRETISSRYGFQPDGKEYLNSSVESVESVVARNAELNEKLNSLLSNMIYENKGSATDRLKMQKFTPIH